MIQGSGHGVLKHKTYCVTVSHSTDMTEILLKGHKKMSFIYSYYLCAYCSAKTVHFFITSIFNKFIKVVILGIGDVLKKTVNGKPTFSLAAIRPELQIRGVIQANSKIIFPISQ